MVYFAHLCEVNQPRPLHKGVSKNQELGVSEIAEAGKRSVRKSSPFKSQMLQLLQTSEAFKTIVSIIPPPNVIASRFGNSESIRGFHPSYPR